MAIIAIDPPKWQESNVVQVDSDASSNDQAILEMDEWAAENGFARVNLYWLRQIVKSDGRRVFRGICYRLTTEEMESASAACQSNAEALASMPVTSHQIDEGR